MSQNIKLDQLDHRIIDILQKDGRIANSKLAQMVGYSAPTVLERVKKLERSGVIQNYKASLEPRLLGLNFQVYTGIEVEVSQLGNVKELEERFHSLPEVLACYHIAGDFDFLLKVCVKNQETYKDFVTEQLSEIKGIKRIQSWVVLSTIKDDNIIQMN
ncbi:MAG: AsnC family transcriptional regulator [Acidobacteria bacterium]|nr:MAG: AsnC family transcriptional regulator [Acidobacteriota bacterium]